jgi:hypothetical protein
MTRLSCFRIDGDWVILPMTMNPLRHSQVALSKRLTASVCLLAVILVWSPLWAAALEANGMACCAGGMCAAHSHSKANQAQPRQATPEEAPMNCGHHSGNGMTNCAMSCCPETNHSFTASVNFVLPSPTILAAPVIAVNSPAAFAATEFVLTFEPASPPPRTSLLSL